jgi:hypothetical protein
MEFAESRDIQIQMRFATVPGPFRKFNLAHPRPFRL